MGGFIVGFDSDPIDIFKRQFDFIQRSGVVTAMVGLLTALPETRLYRRLMQEGRLETESTGNNTQAALNFRPTLSREFLISWLPRTDEEALRAAPLLPAHSHDSWSTNGPAFSSGGSRGRTSRRSSNPCGCSGSGTADDWPTGDSSSPHCSNGRASSITPSNWPSSAITSAAWPSCCEAAALRRERLHLSIETATVAHRLKIADGALLRVAWVDRKHVATDLLQNRPITVFTSPFGVPCWIFCGSFIFLIRARAHECTVRQS